MFLHKALLISTNRSVLQRSLYDATRSAWILKKSKAEQAEVMLATVQGEIIGAFVAHHWLEVTPENFPDRDPVPGRFGFKGDEASPVIKVLSVGKRVSDKYRKRGASNPIKYTW